MNEIEIVKNGILNAEDWLQEFDLRQVAFTEEKDREVLKTYLEIIEQENRQPNSMELVELSGEFPTGSCTQREFNHAFGRLRDRKVGGVVQHIIHDAYTSLQANSTVQGATTALANITKRISLALPSGTSRGIDEIATELKKEIDAFEEFKRENPGCIRGLSTGYTKLDELTDGFRPGQLIMIGARPSGGKTTLAMNIVHNMLLNNKKVVLFSLEMMSQDILAKLIGIHSGHYTKKITNAVLPKEERDMYIDNVAKFPLKIYGVDTKHLNDIQASVSKEVYTDRPDMIVIDYAQRIKTDFTNETQSHNEIADRIQAIALQYEIPILMLSQMSNQHLNNKNVEIGAIGMKGAGAYADVSNFAYEIVMDLNKKELDALWEKKMPVPKKLITQKSRDGAGGTVYFLEHGARGKFEEITYDQYTKVVDEAKEDVDKSPFEIAKEREAQAELKKMKFNI